MGEPVTYALRVRYSECDRQNIVFNAHYLAWLDDSMTELFRAACGGYDALDERGIDVVLAEARLRYRAPARFDELLSLSVLVGRIGETSLACTHAVRRGEELLMEGETRHVFVDSTSWTKVRAPDWIRSALEPYCA